jgi:hypothetical protein
MSNYAFLSSENKIINLSYIEDDNPNKEQIIEEIKNSFQENSVSVMKISDQKFSYSIGDTWNGECFIPPKPYPSWMWDPNKHVWRPPVIHPNLWSNLDSKFDNEYIWSEEEKQWKQV